MSVTTLAARGASPIQNDYGALFITILIALPIVVLVVGSMLLENRRRQTRTDAMRQLASDLGLKFDEQVDSFEQRMAEFHIGTDRQANIVRNMMSGQSDGIAFKAYDFEHVTGNGKNRNSLSQTVVELLRNGDARPKFFVRPERSLWVRSLFEEYRDFDFENHPVFSKRYQLSGDNEAAVRELFTASVIEFFEQHDRLWVESVRGRFLYCREGVLVEPGEIRAFVDEARCCLRLLEDSAK